MYSTLLHRPRSSGRFATLMELYEQNYMLVRLLVPELRSLQADRYVSIVTAADETAAGLDSRGDVAVVGRGSRRGSPEAVLDTVACAAIPLELSQLLHERYTTTFNLTYRFSTGIGKPKEPDLLIRLYHDARTCEVLSGLVPGLGRDMLRTRNLREGRQLNGFLNKWLTYCLHQGHSFGPHADARIEKHKAGFAPTLLFSVDSTD